MHSLQLLAKNGIYRLIMLEKLEQHLYQKVFPLKPPELVYHYTTQKGILGIIKNQEMWATQIHFLNDKNEIFLAFKLLNNELVKRFNAAVHPDYKEFLQSIIDYLATMDHGHICIASFCEVGDLLSQWRGYGNLGKGYALGFDLKKLTKLAKKHSFVFWPCIYDPILQQELVNYLIDNWCQKFYGSKIPPKDMFKSIDIDVCQLAPIIKDESFNEEQEWRLISSIVTDDLPRFDFREGQYSLIPYYNFPITDPDTGHCINKIVVGPSPHVELAKNSLRNFLNSQRMSKTQIEISKIPFRNWK